MAHVHETLFLPNPVQRAFVESRAKADLFSSRMGEGKSAALCWACLYHTRHNPGATWALIRDTFENMQRTTQKEFFKWFPPGIYGTYNAGKKLFTWAEGVAKGEVYFMGMDDPQDASSLMSMPLAGFGIDEPSPAVGSAGVHELIFDIALSRCRQEGIKWYCGKLAENNPDEAHWTYKRFVNPGDPEFRVWQPNTPENLAHLPATYYADLRNTWKHRPDLIRRFVDGEFGYQQEGKPVTPQWNDKLHLSLGLTPIPRRELILCWDFGHNPTCVITQTTPLGHWNILEAHVGDGIGVEELVGDVVKPILIAKYLPIKCTLVHCGDPAGEQREQTSIHRTAVRMMRRQLGGVFKKGPVKPESRMEPLRALLTRTVGGRGLIQVDRELAAPIWHALRGGWHYHVARTGITSGVAKKNLHSHPGDALSYGAAVYFPLGKAGEGKKTSVPVTAGSYWHGQGNSAGNIRGVEGLARAGKNVLSGVQGGSVPRVSPALKGLTGKGE